MNTAPKFDTYPLERAPDFPWWYAIGAGLFVLACAGAMQLDFGSFYNPIMRFLLIASVLAPWLLIFLLRVLFYRLNRHNSQCYAETSQQIQQAWWVRHRQTVALIEAVLVGGGSSDPEHRQALFSADHQPPAPAMTPDGATVRLLQMFGDEVVEREWQLAKLLVLQWQAQRPEPGPLQPLACYWQGSLSAWQAFVEQMGKTFAQVQLPEQPESWRGIDSLDSIIYRMQGAPSDARILCAGCQSLPARPDSRLPAGEAAVLWLFGPEGGVRFSRGEWFDADTELLPTVAERVLQQSEITSPPQACVSFSQPDVPSLSLHGWNTKQNVQDANFGDLEGLQAMVVQTLAAWYVEQHQVPCAWLANDPHHTLALGIVKPDDSNS
ncbi:hypothetical protein Q8X48_22510 [Pseudomonas sp. QLc11A]|jgi:hypothetical protein|uniref:Uncharacterized protein n=1 Tax=Pseudomonas azerbaijanorientalis TaxID=2842350 RepID=A0ABW8WB07_9PSED